MQARKIRDCSIKEANMRRIVAGLYMSLDGVVENPKTWSSPYFCKEMWEVMGAGIVQADTVLLGRHTYQEFAEFWPRQSSNVPMADFLNNAPKYVVSTTLEKAEWKNSTLLKGGVAEELTELKRQSGKNIQVPGSPRLVRMLLRDGLLDELALFILPVVVGAGLRLFEEMTHRVGLKLVESRVFSTGALGVTYRPAS
jgi:dihydrofolate reductase